MKNFLTVISFITLSLNFWAANPVVELGSVQVNNKICEQIEAGTTLYDYVKITDADLTPIFIVSIESSDNSVAYSMYKDVLNQANGLIEIKITGNTLNVGNFFATLGVSDGIDTIYLTLPNAVVHAPPVVSYTSNNVVCANEGTVNLNQFVDLTGGTFYVFSQEIANGNFNPTTFSITSSQNISVNYSYFDGTCWSGLDEFTINVVVPPLVVLGTIGTNCLSNTGKVFATYNSSTVNSVSWSNGATNTDSIVNLFAGNYTFYLTDTNGCVSTTTTEVHTFDTDLNSVVSAVKCHGQATGSIKVTPVNLTAPITYLWNNGKSADSIGNLTAGVYTVYVQDASGCKFSKNIQVLETSALNFDGYPSIYSTCGNADGQLYTYGHNGGVLPYSFLWSNGQTDSILTNVPSGIYTLTMTDANGCSLTKPFSLKDNDAPDIDIHAITAAKCGSSNGSIDVDVYLYTADPLQSITWSNGATTEDISNLQAGYYECTAIVANSGCKTVKGWNVPSVQPKVQDICIVTVDSMTTTNLVVWEKAQTTGIDYYKIYRETYYESEYLLIDTVSALNASYFNDVVASPKEKSWSYKISAVDYCGVESGLSNRHKTIHLKIQDNGGNVKITWNAYQGTLVTNYEVYRYSDANGWELAAILPSTQLGFIDAVPFTTPGLDYMVSFTLSSPCSAEKAQDFNTCRSNRERGQFSVGGGVDGVSNNAIDENYLNSISIYPNPTNDLVYFEQANSSRIKYTITSLTGQEIATQTSELSNVVLDLSSVQAGTYFVTLSSGNFKIVKKIVKY